MSQSVLSADFMRWLAASPYAWRQDGDRDEFYEAPDGEVRFYLGRREDAWQLTRASRSGDEIPVMTASKVEDVEKYLSFVIGRDKRAQEGLPGLHMPPLDAGCAFRMSQVAPGWVTLVDVKGPLPFAFRDGGGRVTPVAVMARLVGFDPAQVRASIDDPNGGVVLSGFVAQRS